MVESMSVVVNVMLSLMSVMSPPLPCATYRYIRMVVDCDACTVVRVACVYANRV